MKKSYETGMTSGPLLGKILLLSIFLMLLGILQLLFNAADIIVVGRFTGSGALAAVGSTSPFINLLINVFMGLLVGINVLVVRYYGARKNKDVSEAAYTAVIISIVNGFTLIVLGILLVNPPPRFMGVPEDVLNQSVLYMRIYFLGMPVLMVYNLDAAIPWVIKDTRKPLYFLLASGVVSVYLSPFFVVVLGMGVGGVAWVMVISERIPAFPVPRGLVSALGTLKLDLKQLRIHPRKPKQIAKIGLPTGMQGVIFPIPNVLIQSSISSFGPIAMTGNTASSNTGSFVHTIMNTMCQTSLSSISQSLDDRKYSKIDKVMHTCLEAVTAVGLIPGLIVVATGDGLLYIYSSGPEVLCYGIPRLEIIYTIYFLCGVMDYMVGDLRGLGYSIIPMSASPTGAYGFRVSQVFTVFAAHRSLDVLYLFYPALQTITATARMVTLHKIRRKVPRQGVVSVQPASL